MNDEPQDAATLDRAKSQAIRAAEQLRVSAAEKARQLRDAASAQSEGQTDQLLQEAGDHWGETRLKVDELKVELEAYVRQNPTKSILLTFGAGVILGMLLKR